MAKAKLPKSDDRNTGVDEHLHTKTTDFTPSVSDAPVVRTVLIPTPELLGAKTPEQMDEACLKMYHHSAGIIAKFLSGCGAEDLSGKALVVLDLPLSEKKPQVHLDFNPDGGDEIFKLTDKGLDLAGITPIDLPKDV